MVTRSGILAHSFPVAVNEVSTTLNNGGQAETGAELLQRILVVRRAAWEAAELEKMQAKCKTPEDDKWKQKYKEPTPPPDTSDLPDLPDN